MNSFIRKCKFLKLSSAAVLESEKPVVVNVNAKYLLRHLHHFSTISDIVVDDDEKKIKPLPKIASRDIAELLKSSCGFPPEEANALEARLLTSYAKKPLNIEKARNVIEFFRDCAGFSDTHIRKVISKRPKLLNSSVEKTLKPKIRAFEDLGLSAPEIGDYISKHVSCFNHKSAKITAFFSKYCPRKEDVARLIKRMPPAWDYGRNLDAQISKYLEHGVSEEKVARTLLNWPELLCRKPEVIEEVIQKAYKFGFKYGDGMLMVAVRVIDSMSESTWESKFQVLRSHGWKDDDIVMAFRKSPTFLTFSLGRIKRILAFFMEELKYETFDIASCSPMLIYSLDKRIIPRYNLIKELECKGLLKRKLSLSSVIIMSERRFREDFVLDIKDEQDLVESYLKSVGNV